MTPPAESSGSDSRPESLFARISLFGDDMTREDAARIADVMRPRDVDAGEVLIQQGDPADSLFIVAAGELAVTVEGGGEELEVARILAGHWAGELAMLDPGPASATVTARSAARVLELSHEELLALMKAEPTLAAHLLRTLTQVLARRVRRTSHGVINHGRWDWSAAGDEPAGRSGWFSSMIKSIFHPGDE